MLLNLADAAEASAQAIDNVDVMIFTHDATRIAVLLWLCIEARRRQKVLVYEYS